MPWYWAKDFKIMHGLLCMTPCERPNYEFPVFPEILLSPVMFAKTHFSLTAYCTVFCAAAQLTVREYRAKKTPHIFYIPLYRNLRGIFKSWHDYWSYKYYMFLFLLFDYEDSNYKDSKLIKVQITKILNHEDTKARNRLFGIYHKYIKGTKILSHEDMKAWNRLFGIDHENMKALK